MTHVTTLVPLVLTLPLNLALLVLPQDIYMSIPPTTPSENVLNHVHMETMVMTLPKLVTHVQKLIVVIVPVLNIVPNVLPQCISITPIVFPHVQKVTTETPQLTLVKFVTDLV